MTKKKTAAVYNRWFHTLGGGEQSAYACAEALRDKGFAVTLLTHQKIDLKEAEAKLNVNLKNISVKYLPFLEDFKLGSFTEEYDLFINSSYLDYIPNKSKLGILNVFFPSEIRISVYEYLKRGFILPLLRYFFIYPTIYEGFKKISEHSGRVQRELSEESTIIFNANLKVLQVKLHFEYFSFSVLDSITFWLNEKATFPSDIKILHKTNDVFFTFKNIEATKHKRFTIKIPACKLKKSKISLALLYTNHYRFWLYTLFKTVFPKWEMRLHGGPNVTQLSDIKSYQKTICNSQFTKRWIKEYWGIESSVVYAPVAVEDFKPAKKKKNQIIHVGRFFLGGHSKKQLELVKVFKTLVKNGGVSDWELHLVGRVADGNIHQNYIKQIKKEIKGYPIFLHLDLTFAKLQTMLGESKIYWHATGLDEDTNKFPIKMEHFGITTVEAMASGCVPVVINKGAQPEIISSKSGFLWNTRDELMNQTLQIMEDEQLLKAISSAAITRSKHFSKAKYKERVLDAIRKDC